MLKSQFEVCPGYQQRFNENFSLLNFSFLKSEKEITALSTRMAVTGEIIRSSDVSVDDELTKVPAYHVCF